MKRVETGLLLAGTAAASTAVFLADGAALLPFVTFPFVAWAGMRGGRAITAVTVGILAFTAAAGTIAGSGPFNALGQSAARAGFEVGAFIATMAAIGLALAAASDQRRRGQRSLAHERDFIATLLDSLADGVIACDASGSLATFNRRAEEIHGLPPHPIPPERWAEFYDIYLPGTERHPTQDQIPLLRALRGERVREAEFDVAPIGGRRVTTSVSGQQIRGADGSVLGAVVVMRDISERKRAEAALLEAEERWRKMFVESPVATALVSPDLRLTEVNTAFSDLIGYSPDELASMTFPDITHPADVSLDVALAERLFGGQIPRYDIEKRYITRQGRQVWANLTASVIRDAHGNPLYEVAVVQDITKRKRFEDRLQYLADHDDLTGLYNRRRLDEELERQVASARRYRRGGALLLIDLDDFKDVNDTLGHPAGDELLRRIASAMQKRVRSSDVLGRMGGDEFALILPEAHEEEAQAVADALREAIYGERARGSDIRTTATVGIALQRDLDKSASQLLVEADLALYAAKHGGRNMSFVYHSARA